VKYLVSFIMVVFMPLVVAAGTFTTTTTVAEDNAVVNEGIRRGKSESSAVVFDVIVSACLQIYVTGDVQNRETALLTKFKLASEAKKQSIENEAKTP